MLQVNFFFLHCNFCRVDCALGVSFSAVPEARDVAVVIIVALQTCEETTNN